MVSSSRRQALKGGTPSSHGPSTQAVVVAGEKSSCLKRRDRFPAWSVSCSTRKRRELSCLSRRGWILFKPVWLEVKAARSFFSYDFFHAGSGLTGVRSSFVTTLQPPSHNLLSLSLGRQTTHRTRCFASVFAATWDPGLPPRFAGSPTAWYRDHLVRTESFLVWVRVQDLLLHTWS
jgi:hypothetical protein